MTDTPLPNTVLPILLAGGEGTRLRPITSDLPKPLIPVDGVPALCRILDTLSALGADRAVITVRYRADDIVSLLGGSYAGIRLFYAREDGAARGTAGAVRDAWARFSAPEDEDALVISGDAVFTCDLASFAAQHRTWQADASLLCVSVEDPGAFGIVITGEDSRIAAFAEKPCAAETLSDTVNTGIYCLRRTFLERIPTEGAPDFGADIFPQALTDGCALYGYAGDGYWCDIGSHHAYLRCSLDISAGRIPCVNTPRMHPVLPPHLTECSIGRECFIPSTASVRESILFDRVHIGRGASVSGSILCADVRVGNGVIIEPGCVLGRGCVIDDHMHLPRGTKLEPGSRPTSAVYSRNTPADDAFSDGARLTPFLSDTGYRLSVGTYPVPETVLAFARALAAFAGKQNAALLICRSGDERALTGTEALLRAAFACMPDTDGSGDIFFADAVLPLSAARMPDLPLPSPVYRIVLHLLRGCAAAAVFDPHGLYPTRTEERQLDACFAEALSAQHENLRRSSDADSRGVSAPSAPRTVRSDVLTDAYLARYGGTVHHHNTRLILPPFAFSCGKTPEERLLAALLSSMGGTETPDAPLQFSIAAPSEESADILCPLTVTEQNGTNTVTADHWTLITLLSAARDAQQGIPYFPTPRTTAPGDAVPLSLPVCAPLSLSCDLRYSHAPAGTKDTPARLYAAMEGEDALLLARDTVCLMAAHGCSLSALLERFPACRPMHRRFGLAASHAEPGRPLTLSADLGRLMREKTEGTAFRPALEGVICQRSGGSVRIVATRDRNFRIVADAYTTEAADALFDYAKERLLCTLHSAKR